MWILDLQHFHLFGGDYAGQFAIFQIHASMLKLLITSQVLQCDIPITDHSQCKSDYWVEIIPWCAAVGAPHCTLHRNTDLHQRSPPFQACQHYVPYATLYIVTGRAPQHASSPSQTWSHRGAC